MLSLRSISAAATLAVFVVASQLQPVAAAPMQAGAGERLAHLTPVVAPQTQAAAVEKFAQAQLNKPYRFGATGLHRYDCSGLVYRTYFETGLLAKVSGSRRRANGYYEWFKRHGLITRHPQPGDLVVWAHRHHRVSHIGIFVGYNRWGKAMAISALINPYGVSVHRVNGIHVPFKAYLKVNMTR